MKGKFFITTNGSSGISRRKLETTLQTIKEELEYILENYPDEIIDIEINSYEEEEE